MPREYRTGVLNVCGGTWPTINAFIQAMRVQRSWAQGVIYSNKGPRRTKEDALTAIFASRVWHGWDADEETVRDGVRELLGMGKPHHTKEALEKKAAEKANTPECPKDARAAVALFREVLPHHEDSDLLAAHWKVEAAGEGRWKFRGEELTWIVEPERERLECWRKGVMVRKWEKGEYRT